MAYDDQSRGQGASSSCSSVITLGFGCEGWLKRVSRWSRVVINFDDVDGLNLKLEWQLAVCYDRGRAYHYLCQVNRLKLHRSWGISTHTVSFCIAITHQQHTDPTNTYEVSGINIEKKCKLLTYIQ